MLQTLLAAVLGRPFRVLKSTMKGERCSQIGLVGMCEGATPHRTRKDALWVYLTFTYGRDMASTRLFLWPDDVTDA
jgi:hypothetical protein